METPMAGKWMTAVGTLVAVLCLSGAVMAGDKAAEPKLLSEGTAVLGADGLIVGSDSNDVWVFKVEKDAKAAGAHVAAGTEMPLLPSGVLETILADANDRNAPRYRLSGQVTRYKGRNFLLPTYFLPLSTVKDPNEPAEPNAVEMAPITTDPNLAIPEEIIAKLNERRMLPGPRRRQFDPNAPIPVVKNRGRVMVGRVGFIERRNGRLTFVPDAWGQNAPSQRYGLLPCNMLEQVERWQAALPEPARFEVAGLVLSFKGRDYLLLQQAARVYSYGNFGR